MGLSYKGHKIKKYKNPFVKDTTGEFKNTYLIFGKGNKKCISIEAEMMFISFLDSLIKFKLS